MATANTPALNNVLPHELVIAALPNFRNQLVPGSQQMAEFLALEQGYMANPGDPRSKSALLQGAIGLIGNQEIVRQILQSTKEQMRRHGHPQQQQQQQQGQQFQQYTMQQQQQQQLLSMQQQQQQQQHYLHMQQQQQLPHQQQQQRAAGVQMPVGAQHAMAHTQAPLRQNMQQPLVVQGQQQQQQQRTPLSMQPVAPTPTTMLHTHAATSLRPGSVMQQQQQAQQPGAGRAGMPLQQQQPAVVSKQNPTLHLGTQPAGPNSLQQPQQQPQVAALSRPPPSSSPLATKAPQAGTTQPAANAGQPAPSPAPATAAPAVGAVASGPPANVLNNPALQKLYELSKKTQPSGATSATAGGAPAVKPEVHQLLALLNRSTTNGNAANPAAPAALTAASASSTPAAPGSSSTNMQAFLAALLASPNKTPQQKLQLLQLVVHLQRNKAGQGAGLPGARQPFTGRPISALGIRPITEDERIAKEEEAALAALVAASAEQEKADAAQGALQPTPYTATRKTAYVLNEYPTMQLLMDLAKQHGLKAVHPSCFAYLADAIESHMSGLFTRMSKVARQRHQDPGIKLPHTKIGPNFKAGIGHYKKADQQAEQKRKESERARLHALMQANRKKLDSEQKELVKEAKAQDAQKNEMQAASKALAMIRSTTKGKKSSKLGAGNVAAAGDGGGGSTAAAGEGAATAAAGGAKPKSSLRGTFGSFGRLNKAGGGTLGKREAPAAPSGSKDKDAAVKKEGGTDTAGKADERPKKKAKQGEPPKPAAASAGTAGAAAASAVKSEPAIKTEPGAAEPSAAAKPGPLQAVPSGEVGTLKKRGSTPGVGDAGDGAANRPGSLALPLHRRDAEKGPPELTARDLLVALEKDPLLNKQPVLWKVYGELSL